MFLFDLLVARLLWLPFAVMSVACHLLGARDVNAANTLWDLDSSKTCAVTVPLKEVKNADVRKHAVVMP